MGTLFWVGSQNSTTHLLGDHKWGDHKIHFLMCEIILVFCAFSTFFLISSSIFSQIYRCIGAYNGLWRRFFFISSSFFAPMAHLKSIGVRSGCGKNCPMGILGCLSGTRFCMSTFCFTPKLTLCSNSFFFGNLHLPIPTSDGRHFVGRIAMCRLW